MSEQERLKHLHDLGVDPASPGRIARAREAIRAAEMASPADDPFCEAALGQLVIYLRQSLDTLESQRAELEAARRLREASRPPVERHYLDGTPIDDESELWWAELHAARDAYDALRSQDTTTGCYDPWGLERSE